MASRTRKRRPSTRTSYAGAWMAGIATIVLTVAIAGAVASLALASIWLEDLPDYQNLEAYEHPQASVVYASDGKTVLAEFQLENRQPVAWEDVSLYAKQATVAIEDERFYRHTGVDFIGIVRALVNNLAGGRLEGASTITQQYVRNTVLFAEMSEISLKRKVREAFIALQLERMLSKDEILLNYMNTINYGSGCYGIEAASQRYFSKSAAELSLAEAATLAAIPQSPTYNNPIDYPDVCLERRNIVLDRMHSAGAITLEERTAAQNEPLALAVSDPPATGILRFPYFTSYVRNRLTDPEGAYSYSSDQIHQGGLRIYTTLDVDMQLAAEKAAQAKQNEANAAAGSEDVFECAMVAIDPSTGHIKALVGGSDFSKSQVNLATGEGGMGRQAGSAFKTFTLVAALEHGISPATLIDASSSVSVPGSTPVSNIDGRNYGTRSIASAFAVSSNTAFMRLIMSLGPSAVADVAHRMGITASLPLVASITLGTEAVTPLEMASAYSTLAAEGRHYEPECILRVEDADGNILANNERPAGMQVISPEVAYAAVSVMKGVVTNGTGFDALLSSGQPVAGKTGTSDRYRDSWFCGITPQLSVAVWLGDRSDYAYARSIPSSITATSAFTQFMNEALQNQTVRDFSPADPPSYRTYYDSINHIGGFFTKTESAQKEEEADEKDELVDDSSTLDKDTEPVDESDDTSEQGATEQTEAAGQTDTTTVENDGESSAEPTNEADPATEQTVQLPTNLEE